MIRTKLFSKIMAIAVIGYCLVQGCGKSASNHNPYVGNMNDFSYSGQWTDDACVYRMNALGEEVCVAEFLTVITSANAEYQSIPTQQTAKGWAQRFGLNPARVVAATDKWGMTIPTHILFSPTGQTLYRAQGFHTNKQIREIMDRYMRDWENWSDTGAVADWMRVG
jgi:hypothetical protein